jgi:nucleotide-binding universal stress UspA family protein
LFVTDKARSCVDLQTGRASLNKVLLAVDGDPRVQAAIDRTVTMLENLGGGQSHVTLLHVGPESQFPHVELPASGEIQWTKVSRLGNAAEEITQHAAEMSADLIVMLTPRSKPLWDLIAGNTVQQVLRHAPCPVFTMPS